jgi:monoamine oxidase
MDSYDVIIVGAGLAGLHAALRISEKNPSLRIAIAEAYDYVGGRIFTYHHNKLRWEAGAGRYHESHKLLKKYIQKYKLTPIPIGSEEQWISQDTQTAQKNIWEELSEIITTSLSSVNPSLLGMHTLERLLEVTQGRQTAAKILERFPYRAEVKTLRADLAMKSFQNEMHNNKGFYVIKEGLSALAKAMQKELESRGVLFLLNHRLVGVSKNTFEQTVCKFDARTLKANKLILAVHSEALKQIHPFSKLPILKHLAMEPLLRTYGVFPKESWFSKIPKTVTDSKLRYIIPINPSEGTIMTSYTDADDTRFWSSILDKKGEHSLQEKITEELRLLFPSVEIPTPLFFKSHLWTHGCTYWLPGRYNPQEVSEKFMQPMPSSFHNVHICGESYSLRQAWMEGALEHTEAMLKKYFL